MANHNDTGKKGENIAIELLHHKGYHIEAVNKYIGKAEIDIIATKDDTLIFVEVKTRTNLSHGRPEEFVGLKKQKMLYHAAATYMDETGHEGAVRFDVIAITLIKNQTPRVEHFEDAFFPELE